MTHNSTPTIEDTYRELERISEVINDHLWYVNPEKLRTALTTIDQNAREEAYQTGRAHEAQQCRGSAADNHPNAPYELPELYPWKDSFERLIAKSDHPELDHDSSK